MTTEERLLSEEEVAARLHMTTSTLRWWRQKAKGPEYRRIGKHIRYRPADVDAWIAQQPNTPFIRQRG